MHLIDNYCDLCGDNMANHWVGPKHCDSCKTLPRAFQRSAFLHNGYSCGGNVLANHGNYSLVEITYGNTRSGIKLGDLVVVLYDNHVVDDECMFDTLWAAYKGEAQA